MVSVFLTQYDGAILGPIAKVLGWILNGIFEFLSNFGIENAGFLAIKNEVGAVASNITVTTTSGNATGIYNTGLLDIDGVSVIVTAPTGTATAIHNENIK